MFGKALFALLTAMIGTVAFAESVNFNDLPPLGEWFDSPFTLGIVLGSLIQLVKKHIGVQGTVVKIAAITLGVATGLLAVILGFVETYLSGVVLGVLAGVVAAGGKDLVRSILKVMNGSAERAENNDTRTSAARARR